MGELIQFRKREERPTDKPEPHQAGEAFCMACDHTWAAVAPVGTVWFECPNCHAHKGHFTFECGLPNGTLVRTCKCGNQLFNLTPEGHFCPNCGTWQTYD